MPHATLTTSGPDHAREEEGRKRKFTQGYQKEFAYHDITRAIRELVYPKLVKLPRRDPSLRSLLNSRVEIEERDGIVGMHERLKR